MQRDPKLDAPPGANRDQGVRGEKRGVGSIVTGHGAEAGMCCGAQRQELEAGGWWVVGVGWWVKVTSRCTALCARRGGGDRVQERGDTRTNSTDLKAVG